MSGFFFAFFPPAGQVKRTAAGHDDALDRLIKAQNEALKGAADRAVTEEHGKVLPAALEAGACFSQIKVTERILMEIQKAFLDTNVLLRNIIGGDEQENELIRILKSNNFQIVTFQKCVYELYSMVKNIVISELSGTHKEDTIKQSMPVELIDICATLRKKFFKIEIPPDDRFFWYNQCEEWCDRDFTEELRCIENDIESHESVKLQRDIYHWKHLIRESFISIDRKIIRNFIHVYTYHDIYNSDWYKSEGFAHEEDLMKNSFAPNEDFEILIAAAFCKARIFITNDQEILRRTGASWGTCCAPSFTSFCCPERLEEAINSQFSCRSYPSLKPKE